MVSCVIFYTLTYNQALSLSHVLEILRKISDAAQKTDQLLLIKVFVKLIINE